jgi:hypothetical protein
MEKGERRREKKENEKTKAGLEALAGDVPLPPAEASSPVSIIH